MRFVWKDIAHSVGGASRRSVVMVGVALQGERGGSVSGECLQVSDGLTTLGEQRQATMPEIVEPDSWETGALEERLVGAVDDVLGVQGRAFVGGEDETVILPLSLRHEPLLRPPDASDGP